MNKHQTKCTDIVLDNLNCKFWLTKQALMQVTGLSRNNLNNTVERLLDGGRIISTRFKHSKGIGRPEVAYMSCL